jgi:DNA (cytosine-5)-methyltransferase 1
VKELVVDSFAGGGGASEGIRRALGRGPDIAINHDPEAVALHAANHPDTRHYVENVWKVDPIEATAGQPVGLMWLSPDCKHFSKAKGGKPVNKKVRGLAWVATRWAADVKPRVIVIENVEEFQGWGPVLADGKPCPVRKGQTFLAFVRKLRRLGYEVQWRELRACDYGAPTKRKRLFIVARCDGRPIVWPTPTHGKGRALPWRTAAECIDFSIPCPSIFDRKKPLAEKTMARIARGTKRFVVDSPKPFIVNMSHGGSLESIDAPMTTVKTEKGGCRALVAPTLIQTGYGERDGQAPRSLDIQQPLGTVVAGGAKHALVAAFLAKHYSERSASEVQGASLFDPAPTVTTVDHNALVAAHLTTYYGPKGEAGVMRGQDLDSPLATQGTANRHALVQAFMTAYFGNEKDGADLFDPMRTVTSRDRFGLVIVEGRWYGIADIGMRMLVPRELYNAQGFGPDYRIEIEYKGKPLTKTAQVRMVGNSVCPPLAEAIVQSNYGRGAGEIVTERAA